MTNLTADTRNGCDLAAETTRCPYRIALWAMSIAAFAAIVLLCCIESLVALSDQEALVTTAAVVAAVLAARRFKVQLLRPSGGSFLLWLVLASLVVRVAFVLATPYVPCADFEEYHKEGMRFAQTGQLGGDYRCFWPPGQIAVLGLLYKVFGTSLTPTETDAGVMAAKFYNVLLAAMTVGGIYLIARRMFNEHVGRLAGILAAVLPSTIYGCMVLGAEVPETFWMVLGLWIYIKWIDSDLNWRYALLCGLAFGIGSLIRPTLVLLAIPMGLHLLIVLPRRQKLRGVLCAMLIGVGTLIPILPWTARNYVVTKQQTGKGGFILVSSNGGGNLWSGNNDITASYYYEVAIAGRVYKLPCGGRYTDETWKWLYSHAHDDLALQNLGMQQAKGWLLGSPPYSAMYHHPEDRTTADLERKIFNCPKCEAWLNGSGPRHNHLLQFAAMMPQKFVSMWLYDRDMAWWVTQQPEADQKHPKRLVLRFWADLACSQSDGYYLALGGLCIVALVRWRKYLLAHRAWMIIAIFGTYFTLIHMVFESQAKYHYMMVPLFCILAALPAARRRDMAQACS